ncbi:GGDEF domain-containing protein [Enterobacter bugandensis]|uniref:GGDEF domain-containing protein n=1 Tax=Enterobacter bugandensis TaxID=881260 RepID=UPI00066898AD|nr:GGDEF domain-containing protein [Enterobacter bugandensis]
MRLIRKESPDVYRALVAELSRTLIPTSMMGITLLIIGSYAFWIQGSIPILLGTLMGGAGSIAKVIIILLQMHRLRLSSELPGLDKSKRWELAHTIMTVTVSSSVSLLASLMFLSTHSQLHLLATALLFGYCAGVSTRLAPRPVIASTAMVIATIPAIIGTFMMGETSHRMVSVIFLFFLLGGIHSVMYIHRNSVRNISMRLDMEVLARNDPLTGMANRLGLREAFRRTILKSRLIAIHCIDLDGFKDVNDNHGHASGDRVLKIVADRLKRIVPEGATVARIGGDEFVVLQNILSHVEESDVLREQIDTSLKQPFELPGMTIHLSGSVGTASCESLMADLDVMLNAADEMLYNCKRLRHYGLIKSQIRPCSQPVRHHGQAEG